MEQRRRFVLIRVRDRCQEQLRCLLKAARKFKDLPRRRHTVRKNYITGSSGSGGNPAATCPYRPLSGQVRLGQRSCNQFHLGHVAGVFGTIAHTFVLKR